MGYRQIKWKKPPVLRLSDLGRLQLVTSVVISNSPVCLVVLGRCVVVCTCHNGNVVS